MHCKGSGTQSTGFQHGSIRSLSAIEHAERIAKQKGRFGLLQARPIREYVIIALLLPALMAQLLFADQDGFPLCLCFAVDLVRSCAVEDGVVRTEVFHRTVVAHQHQPTCDDTFWCFLKDSHEQGGATSGYGRENPYFCLSSLVVVSCEPAGLDAHLGDVCSERSKNHVIASAIEEEKEIVHVLGLVKYRCLSQRHDDERSDVLRQSYKS